eukprot:gb/GEZN01013585.1/.p1 GENE.gb/GEZN01013585.1/~~gb/GEZN01013585.1/.p1  ORF type:complete len:231 (+),score=6.32 gb/GEZN01013585.1/:295-987(+)
MLSAALPDLEIVCGRRLKETAIQVVVRAYEHNLKGEFYHISDWHTDGRPEEHIMATAVCYTYVDPNLNGGFVEFANQSEHWIDDPAESEILAPKERSIIVFNNQVLRHRVLKLMGTGRRRLVAFHLLSPDYTQLPKCSARPRLLSSQYFREVLGELKEFLPPGVPCYIIAEYSETGNTPTELIEQRNRERRLRLVGEPPPDRMNRRNFTTGTLGHRRLRATTGMPFDLSG